MSPLHAWRDGVRRVASAPALLAGVWVATILIALPLTFAVRGAIVRELGTSLEADAAARGMDYEWLQEFGARATGVGSTLRPAIVGFAGTLDNLSGLMDGVRRPASMFVTAAVYGVVWLFLSGGIVERYARQRDAATRTFFAACGAYFPRLLRLGLLAAAAYALLFGALQPWMLGRLYPRLTAGAGEPAAFAARLILYAIFGLLLVAIDIVFDYAKVRAVIEDRRSMTVAVAASLAFIRKHPGTAIGAYALDVLTFGLVMAAYAFAAPSSGGTGAMIWAAFGIGQAYILGRLGVRLLFFATETAAFENRLGVRRH